MEPTGDPEEAPRVPELGVPVGALFVRREEDGRWVILAADPTIKIDNHHDDRIPHLHADGWTGDDRRDLPPMLGPDEAAEAIRRHLVERGYIDVEDLLEELR